MSRMHPRYAVAVECTLAHDGKTLVGQTENLSKGGVSVMLPSTMTVGANVDMSLSLVFENASSSEPLRLRSQVVWCTPLGKSYQIGAQFVAPTPDQRNFLDVFLRFLDGEVAAGPDDEAPALDERAAGTGGAAMMDDEKNPGGGDRSGERSHE